MPGRVWRPGPRGIRDPGFSPISTGSRPGLKGQIWGTRKEVVWTRGIFWLLGTDLIRN